jgi:hypothetical protein
MTVDETEAQFQEILYKLDNPKNGNRPPTIPLIDPTANVLSLVKASIDRQDDLRHAELKRQDDLREQAEAYERQLAVAESRRLDAVIASQKSDVAIASEKAAAQATTLAAVVAQSAEALRTQVANTAITTSDAIATLRDTQDKRLSLLEQNQWQGGGRDLQRTETKQTNQWTNSFVASLVFGVMGTIVGMGSFIYIMIRIATGH